MLTILAAMLAMMADSPVPLPPMTTPPVLAQPPVRVFSTPDWARIPTAEEFEEAYPKQAWSDDVEGRTTMICRVGLDGRLFACEVEAETPKGQGFGAAALAIAPYFQMKPAMIDGVKVNGAWVRIPVRFAIPEPDESPWTLSEALRCYVSADRAFKADRKNRKAGEMQSMLGRMLRETADAEGVPQAVVDGRIADTEAAMTRGDINGDWCF